MNLDAFEWLGAIGSITSIVSLLLQIWEAGATSGTCATLASTGSAPRPPPRTVATDDQVVSPTALPADSARIVNPDLQELPEPGAVGVSCLPWVSARARVRLAVAVMLVTLTASGLVFYQSYLANERVDEFSEQILSATSRAPISADDALEQTDVSNRSYVELALQRLHWQHRIDIQRHKADVHDFDQLTVPVRILLRPH